MGYRYESELSITDLPESSGLLYVGFGLIVLAILLRARL